MNEKYKGLKIRELALYAMLKAMWLENNKEPFIFDYDEFLEEVGFDFEGIAGNRKAFNNFEDIVYLCNKGFCVISLHSSEKDFPILKVLSVN
jgi:hypothetical protein